ncbi:MAG TPA: type I methionyl aminopeptidase [bacterium]|nr:type I methionyl aminopeptidase [bacterium]
MIKTSEEIKIMAEGGRILAQIIKELEKMIEPGVVTKELDKATEGLVLRYGAECSFKNYTGPDDEFSEPFPSCLITSINEEVVHGIPSDRILKNGDIVSLDLGIKYKGFHTDMAVTIPIGIVNAEALKLIRVTKTALKKGIKTVKHGNTIGDIGNAVQKYTESNGFSVVQDLCGHGIGKNIHEDPQILNYGKKRTGLKLIEGMTFCIEPMLTLGNGYIKKSSNGHCFETQDGFLSAHFEHTIAVTKNGYRILTL